MVKLRRVLRAIRKHFPQPPDEIMAENAIEKFLDDPNLCEDTLAELPRSGVSREPILNILFADGRGPESFKTSLTARFVCFILLYTCCLSLCSNGLQLIS